MGAPVEKLIKNGDGDVFADDPVVIEIVVLSHFLEVFFDEVVDVLAKQVHGRLP